MIINTIIFGSGMAGLNLTSKLAKSDKNIMLLDRNNYYGGRVHTIYRKNYQYEAGGARFNKNHINLIKLLKKYNLHKIKIPSNWNNINKNYKKLDIEYDDVNKLITDLIKVSEKKSKAFLMKHTLITLCETLFGSKYAKFLGDYHPYYSEIFVTNAYDALQSVKLDLREDKQFYIIQEGFSKLIECLVEDIKNQIGNSRVKLNHQLLNISYENQLYTCIVKNLRTDKIIEYQSKNLILAIDSNGLKKIKYLSPIKEQLNSVSCLPLLRIYQKYPLNSKNEVWFQNLSKVVTNNKLKYIIPVNKKQGIIMISYTDAKYSTYWKNQMDNNSLEEKIKHHLILLFPDLKIPKPSWTQTYYWDLGACYWKPNYNSDKISKFLAKPFKNQNLYICGSNYSQRQAWVEGALESSNNIFNNYLNKY